MYEFHWRDHVMSRDWLLVRGIAITALGAIGIGLSIAFTTDSGVFAYSLGFLTGTALFCTYGPQLVGDEPTHPHAYGNLMAMGVAFLLWGPLLSIVTCVSFGSACAIVCTLFVWTHSRSWLIRLAPLSAYACALGVYALFSLRMGGGFSLEGLFTDTALIAVLWNVFMFAQLVWARHLKLPDERRRLAGLCQACGYDMTGIAEGDRCPECGRRRTD